MSALLALEGLRVRFGGLEALAGLSFALEPGERVALIGPNGAGKTTCFNAIDGRRPPDRGRVVLDGRDIAGTAPHRVQRLGVGRTFQITGLFASMTARQNVQAALIAHRHGVLDPTRLADRMFRAEATELLERVGLSDAGDGVAGSLAHGDKKRLELAVALAGEPRLLLMDEPTAGMAPGERTALMELVDETADAAGLTLLFTEHDMDVVFAHAWRIVVLDRGAVIADGPPEAVRENAEVRAVYLGD